MIDESTQPNLTLLTGATGFIGGHIAQVLAKEKRPLRILLRENSPTKNLEDVNFEAVYGDITDYASVVRAMQDVQTVYHTAALFELWQKREENFYDVNVRGTENICKAAFEAGVKKMVYTSTTGTIGIATHKTKLCDEKTPWNREWTNDPYTLSKFKAEQVVLHYIKKGLNAVIVNPTSPIGPGDIRPTPTGKLICDFLKGDFPFYINAHFSIADVRDIALGHLLAEIKGKVGERYILSAENLSAKDLFKKLASAQGVEPPTLKIPIWVVKIFAYFAEIWSKTISHKPPLITKAYAKLLPHYFWFDNSKSMSELGLLYRPVDYAIKEAVEWFKKEGYTK